MIDLKILLPERTYWQGKVKKIVGEATNSSFCLPPAHVDLVTIMVPGIFFVLFYIARLGQWISILLWLIGFVLTRIFLSRLLGKDSLRYRNFHDS